MIGMRARRRPEIDSGVIRRWWVRFPAAVTVGEGSGFQAAVYEGWRSGFLVAVSGVPPQGLRDRFQGITRVGGQVIVAHRPRICRHHVGATLAGSTSGYYEGQG